MSKTTVKVGNETLTLVQVDARMHALAAQIHDANMRREEAPGQTAEWEQLRDLRERHEEPSH